MTPAGWLSVNDGQSLLNACIAGLGIAYRPKPVLTAVAGGVLRHTDQGGDVSGVRNVGVVLGDAL